MTWVDGRYDGSGPQIYDRTAGRPETGGSRRRWVRVRRSASWRRRNRAPMHEIRWDKNQNEEESKRNSPGSLERRRKHARRRSTARGGRRSSGSGEAPDSARAGEERGGSGVGGIGGGARLLYKAEGQAEGRRGGGQRAHRRPPLRPVEALVRGRFQERKRRDSARVSAAHSRTASGALRRLGGGEEASGSGGGRRPGGRARAGGRGRPRQVGPTCQSAGEREERWAGGRLRGPKEESGLRDLLCRSGKE
jgi:hypothetical protein